MPSSLSYIPRYHDLNVTYSQNHKATVHYVEAGNPDLPKLLLLHGFPSSSFQFRDFIPMLSDNYHVLVPDLPGFGLTEVDEDFVYTFANLTLVIAAWLKALDIKKTAVYLFDYGAPVGFRLATADPPAIEYSAIISQNGNIYEEGLGQKFWAPLMQLWKTNSNDSRQYIVDHVLNQDGIKRHRIIGIPQQDLDLIDPITWTLDYLKNIQGDINIRHQLDLFYDYRTNVAMYPSFQRYVRESNVPILAIWGKFDPSFIPAGAEAFRKDSPHTIIELLDTAHWALETKRWEIARISRSFLASVGW